MGELLKAVLVPHPPIMIPEVGGAETEKVQATVTALKRLEGEFKLLNPDTLIVITPHGTVFSDGLAVTTSRKLKGDLGQFNARNVSFRYHNNSELAEEIVKKSTETGINTLALDDKTAVRYGVTTELDHGIMAPLYYLGRQLPEVRLVSIAMGMLPYLQLYRFGMALAETVRHSNSRALLVASGDMSHRLTHDAPAGYDPRGQEFDRTLADAVKEFDVFKLLNLPGDLVQAAGECGLRPLTMLLGALDGFTVETKVMSYEGPFGVGYLVADFQPGIFSAEHKRYQALEQDTKERLEASQRNESDHVKLARRTLEYYVKEGKTIEPDNYDAELKIKAGAFVSIKKDGQLRGCIGTTAPTRKDLAHEIVHNAISAGTRDPRFPAVSEEELPFLNYSVDVLKPAEKIDSIKALDPRRYGVIVSNGSRSGLLLPDLEGIDTAEQQVAIAKQKAGIGEGEPCELERFEVERFY